MFDEIIKKINESKNILIFTHSNPDGDALGSSLGLANALNGIGKKADIYLEKKKPDMFSCFEGPFILDAETEKYDLKIALDCGDKERMGDIADKFFGNTINIDHHNKNTGFALVNYADPDSAATGEIIYKLLKEMNIPMDSVTAGALYGAILTDTGGFMFSNTTPSTHRIAADLIECGASYYELNKKLMQEKSMHRHVISARCIDKMEFLKDGKICICVIDNDMCNSFSITSEELNGLPALLRSVTGVEVGALITEAVKGIVKVSLRSDKIVDVSEIARKFGGGGHVRASGIRITDKDIAKVKEEITNELIKCF